ncbi:MAG: response regulator [Leptospirales bacterium]|nr:response regulator [Leptospirales bacterium]
MFQKCLCFVSFLCALAVSGLHAQSVVDLAGRDRVPVGRDLEIFEDSEGQVGFEEVQKKNFIQSQAEIYSAGFTTSTVWARFRVNGIQGVWPWILQIESPLLEEVDVYFLAPDGTFQKRTTGLWYPFGSREIAHRTFLFRVPFESNQQLTVYIRAKTRAAFLLPVSIVRFDTFQAYDSILGILYGFFYGSLFIISSYHLFVFFSVRDPLYLFNILFFSTGAAFMASQQGYLFQYFLPDAGRWSLTINLMLNSLGAFWVGMFCRAFLNLKVATPRLDRFVQIISISSLAPVVLLFVMPYGILARFMVFLVIISTILICVIGTLLAVRRHRNAGLFLAAFLVFLSAASVYALRNLGVIAPNVWVNNATQLGAFAQLILLSMAVADRINTLKRERGEAEQASKMKSQFLATMSHEIRTPMSGVLGMTGILLETKLDAEQERIARTIQRSSTALLAILNDVLDLSRIESGKLQSIPEPFELRQLLVDVVDMFRPSVSEKVLLRLDLDDGLPENVCGDAPRLRQILLNLLGNAVKFTQSGSITLRVRRGTESAETSRFVFQVIDTGIGIPADKISKLFEAFYQVEGSFARRFGGAGLGLAIVARLVALLGGTIHAQSNEGLGSSFSVEIPFLREANFGHTSSSPAARGTLMKHDILIADDDPISREVILRICARLGHTAQAVAGGFEALAALESKKFTFIFMDMHMPGLDGLQTTERIRSRKEFSELRIVALTANVMPEHRELCIQAGMNDFLSKPVTLEAIQRVLRE